MDRGAVLLPTLERDIEKVIHHDTIYIVKGDTLTP